MNKEVIQNILDNVKDLNLGESRSIQKYPISYNIECQSSGIYMIKEYLFDTGMLLNSVKIIQNTEEFIVNLP